MKVRVLPILISGVLTPLILAACDGTNITAAATVTRLGTDPTSVVAGSSFSDSIRVKVTDGLSNPKSGVNVRFAVTAGGGSVTPARVITDANGKAAAKFITGSTVGTNTATATVTGLIAVTFSTTTVAPPPTLVWSSVSIGTTAYVNGIWGTSRSDVWAVGSDGSSGRIIHYDGTTWSSIATGAGGQLSGVWGTSGSDVWVVGEVGRILHFNGTTWSSVSSGTTLDLKSVWGGSASDVWAVGTGGTTLHYNGSTWSSIANAGGELSGVWGSSATDVWTVGEFGRILHYNGTSWSSVSSGTTQNLKGVWGSSASEVWAVGTDVNGHGTIIHYNGTTWSSALSSGVQVYSVWGSSSSSVWAGGAGSTIFHGSPAG